MTLRSIVSLLPAAVFGMAVVPAKAGDTAPAEADVQVVQVTSSILAERKNDVTMNIVIGHEEIVRFGDQALTDVIKRLPGLTVGGGPGRENEIRMHGLGQGYTQILLNGLPVPTGFSLDTISPESIERIEIRKAASAEYGTQAIAGTINIVLKKKSTPGQSELKVGMVDTRSLPSTTATLQLADQDGAVSYVMAGTLTHYRLRNLFSVLQTEQDTSGATTSTRTSTQENHGDQDTLSLTPRINWNLGDGESLSLQSLFNYSHLDRLGSDRENSFGGARVEFPNFDEKVDMRTSNARSDLSWTQKLPANGELEVKAGAVYYDRAINFDFFGHGPDDLVNGHNQVISSATNLGFVSTGKYRMSSSDGSQALVLGWDASRTQRNEERHESRELSDTEGVTLLNQDYDATVTRLAGYAQDEWEISPRWSLYLGLRWETLATSSEGTNVAQLRNQASVLTPLLQSQFKLKNKDQIRLAFSRLYKAPDVAELVPRRFVVDTTNTPTNPDVQGNPNLHPELAWGLDAAYESYFGQAGMVTLSAYARHIKDVTVRQEFQDSTGRWISMPANDGNASTHGVEIEAKLPLNTVLPGAPAMDLRMNLARNWSRVDQVPGPHNQLDRQTTLSANLGGDYHPEDWPVSVGGNFAFSSGAQRSQSSTLASYSTAKRELELYALWKMNKTSQLRVAGSNLLHQDVRHDSTYVGAAGAILDSLTSHTAATVRVIFEHKL